MICLYNELEVRVAARTEELCRIQEAYHNANSKLNLLNSVTRHDILNQITALYGYLELIRDSVSDTCPIDYLDRAEQAAKCIQEQITFTKLYQDIGVHAPKWQSLWVAIRRAMAGITMERVSVSILMVGNIQVYADPLLEKVFYTLIDNSLRHGRSVTKIMIGTEFQKDSMIIWYEDNGEGIPHDDKDKIFARGYGNNT